MNLWCLPLPWTYVVLTAVVNKFISMSFLKRVSWVCVSHREAHPGMRSLLKLSSRICRRDLLFLSITAAAVFSFHAVAIMLFLLLSSFVMMKSERNRLLLSLSSIIAWRHSHRSVFILFLVICCIDLTALVFFLFCWLRKGCHNSPVFLPFQSVPQSLVVFGVILFLRGDSSWASIEDRSWSHMYKRDNNPWSRGRLRQCYMMW